MGQTLEARVLAAKGLKKCKDCQQDLPFEKFRKVGGGRWYDSKCKDCKLAYDAIYRARDPEGYKAKLRERYHNDRDHYRDLQRRSLYNVPLGTYDLLLERQNGRCAICGAEKSTRNGRDLAIDHCAETNDIRGLLCTPCNQGIGQFRHSVELLEAAINYLLRGGYTIAELQILLQLKTSTDESIEELGL
jgi:hypothetical protein